MTPKPVSSKKMPKKSQKAPKSGAKRTTKKQPYRRKVNYASILQNIGPEQIDRVREALLRLKSKYPGCGRVDSWISKFSHKLDSSRSLVGDAGLSDDVTTITEGPFDLPPVPLNGSTIIERRCRIQKLANQGTAAGGLYAALTTTECAAYSDGVFRIKEVRSWTIPNATAGASAAEFSAVQVPLQEGASGTEVMPAWESNWTRVGTGFSGLITKFPLGDFPLFPSGTPTTILNHFIGDGYVGSATGLSVVFDVLLECLI
jgi:hypothetical protein